MLALLGRRACLLAQQGCAVRRGVTSTAAAHDLRAFLDVELSEDEQPSYGRAWQASELRLKSWSDLHKLWYVCLKERNMLDTQVHWHKAEEDRQKQEEYVHRYRQVKLTMNRIKQVLSERACQELNPVKQSQMKKAIHLM